MAFLTYDLVAEDYAATRRPVGVDLLVGALARSAPLGEHVLLDAGCGTGNYMAALVEQVRAIRGMDQSAEMVRQARRQLGERRNASLVQGNLLALPFPEAHFSGVLCNFVLHHAAAAAESAQATATALSELHRVLRPGGSLILQTASHDQIRDGYWWAVLIPQAIARTQACYLTQEQLLDTLGAVGFMEPQRYVDLDSVLQGPDYLNPEGPLLASYRAGDSAWSKATPDELEQAQEQTRRLLDSGEISGFLQERERVRRRVGQSTFVFARKAP